MQTIYFKATESRKKEYEITTKIIADGDNLFVAKEGVYSNQHILEMKENENKFAKYAPKYVVKGKIVDNAYVVPFLKGDSLAKMILNGESARALQLYKQVINSLKTKKIKDFDPTLTKFYDIEVDEDEESFIVSDFDLTLDNILINDTDIKIIDLEWIYECPIPKKAIIYKAIRDFNNSYSDVGFDYEEWLFAFDITDIETYEAIIAAFYKSTLDDFNYRKQYQKKENYFDVELDYSKISEENVKQEKKNAELADEVSALNVEIDSKSKRISDLEYNVKDLDREKEEYKSRSENYENSTTFRVMKKYWRFRDWLFPKNSRRRLFIRMIGKAIRHPIWFIRHLTPTNIKKFRKYSKSEGAERVFERVEIYQGKTQTFDIDFNVELFDMKEREKYPILEVPLFDNPDVSIIIPVYNQFSYTYGCIESIIKNTINISYEIIIGDDCSTDKTKEISEIIKNIQVCTTTKNVRFLLNCNNAAKAAKGKYILFLNNDTNVQENWLDSLLETIESKPNIGMVGSKLVYPDGRLQEAGGILWKDGSAWNFGNKDDPTRSEYNYRKPVDYISGAAIMIKKSLWDDIGGFDETFIPAYCEDSDLAFQVREKGYEVIYDPFSVVVHYEGVSNGTNVSTGVKKHQVTNSKKFYEKWKNVLEKHPENGIDAFKARERNYNKKTILVIDHYVPEFDKDAGSRTVFDYLNIFIDMGFSVKFMGENFYKNEPYTSILEKLGIEVLYGSFYANNYKNWLKLNGRYFDYVFMNRPHITYKFLNDIKETCTNAKLIYYGHDLHFLRLKREYEINNNPDTLKESEIWKEKELSIYQQVDLIYYPSQIEVDEVKKIDSTLNVKVLQPYVYKDISTNYDPSKRNGLLFVGGFRHGPNYDGVKWFLNDIYPSITQQKPDILWKIAGSYPPKELLELNNKNVKVLGFVTDEELGKLYSETKMVIVPLRFGAGIKGKVIEAMKNGIPVMTTEVGAEGIDSDSLLVENNFKGLLKIYSDDTNLLNISRREIDFIRNNYSYQSSLDRTIDDLKSL